MAEERATVVGAPDAEETSQLIDVPFAATTEADPMFDVPAEDVAADAADEAVAEKAPEFIAAPSAIEM